MHCSGVLHWARGARGSQVARLLDGVDAAVYVLDYTKLKTDDEAGMFERLTHINPALVKRLSQRMFFVVNKVRGCWWRR